MFFFTGCYERTLDGKGRLVLPPKIRSKLPEGGYLVPLKDCVALYPSPIFQDLMGRMTEQVRNGEVPMKALVRITSSAEEVDLDSQGRVGIAARLREQFNLESNDVVVVGASNHVQIWAAANWANEHDESADSAFEVFDRGLV